MERYSEEFGYWKTLWWLVRRFATSPITLLTDLADDWREVLEGLKVLLIACLLLIGPLLIWATPFLAAWKVWDVKRKAAKRRKEG